MNLIERFRYIMKLNAMTASKFADEIGVQRSSVSHILSGRNKPSLEFIQKVLKRFPKVDSSWLISGTISTGNQKPVEEHVEQGAPGKMQNDKLKEELTKSPVSTEQIVSTTKSIKKILVFYEDGTFEEFSSVRF